MQSIAEARTNDDLIMHMEFRNRVEKLREEIIHGMTLKVFLYTGDQKVDGMRDAKVIKKYRHIVYLKDKKGRIYGPSYKQLIFWGN